jgi:hypothetical protein
MLQPDGTTSNSSGGFTGSMSVADVSDTQEKHNIIKKVWDFMDSIPFYTLKPCQSATSSGGYALCDSGKTYLIYFDATKSLTISTAGGPYIVTWINAQNTSDQRDGGTHTATQARTPPPGNDDWLLYLTLQNSATPTLSPATSMSPTPQIGEGDVNGDGIVTILDLHPVLQKFGSTLNDSTDQYKDSIINSFDAVVVMKKLQGVTPTGSTGSMVTRVIVVNADTDLDSKQLTQQDIIDFSDVGTKNINIRAEVVPIGGSVKFGFDGNSAYRIENTAPFSIGGDSAGDYAAWTPTVGNHILTVTPYSGLNATGIMGTPFTISFTVQE